MKHLLLISLLVLSGCSIFPKPAEVVTKPIIVERPKLELPAPAPTDQKPLTWTVITKDNINEKIKEFEAQGYEFVLFGLTPQGYQNLSINIADLRRFIQQQNAIVITLKEYYESPQQSSADSKK